MYRTIFEEEKRLLSLKKRVLRLVGLVYPVLCHRFEHIALAESGGLLVTMNISSLQVTYLVEQAETLVVERT